MNKGTPLTDKEQKEADNAIESMCEDLDMVLDPVEDTSDFVDRGNR